METNQIFQWIQSIANTIIENPIIIGASILASSIPIIIWIVLFLNKKEQSKKTVALIFFLGCLTIFITLGIQKFWTIYPRFNIDAAIKNNITNYNTKLILTFILFGAIEEIIKLYVIKGVDEKTVLINKVNDAVRYSIISALGFSFVENIYYLYQAWPNEMTGMTELAKSIHLEEFKKLANMHIFRSTVTTCAHITFSGIFGYYYGIAKYSIVMTHQRKLTQKVSKISKWLAKTFKVPLNEGFRRKTVLKGLLIAIILHATFNYLLQKGQLQFSIIFVILGYLFLKYLLSRKAGHLILTDDITVKMKSSIAKKDEEVVIELLGMWFKEEKYVDVIHICERLLERDPDNRVVKLFKAKAMDEMSEENIYNKILGTILPSSEEMSELDKNIITKHIKEKDEFEKAKKKIKKQLEKEGKNFRDPAKIIKKERNKKSSVEDFTQGDSFRI